MENGTNNTDTIICSAHFTRLVNMSLLDSGEELTVCKFGFHDLWSSSLSLLLLPQVNGPLSSAGNHGYLTAKNFTTY